MGEYIYASYVYKLFPWDQDVADWIIGATLVYRFAATTTAALAAVCYVGPASSNASKSYRV